MIGNHGVSRRRSILLAGVALAASLGASGTAFAQQSPASSADARDARIGQLEAQVRALVAANQSEAAQIQALTAAIADLKQARATPAKAIQTIPPPAPPSAKTAPAAIASIAGGKPVIASADGRFSLTLHGIVQFDAALYNQSAAGPIATDQRRSGRRSAPRPPTSISPMRASSRMAISSGGRGSASTEPPMATWIIG